jgi:hypothetical protein
MIVSKIKGGLGNQMFCYAAGRAVAQHHGVDFKLDVRGYPDQDGRHFELGRMTIRAETAGPDELARFERHHPRHMLNRMARKLRFWRSYGQTLYFQQRGYAFDPEFRKVGAEAYLEGLFQSEKFFESAADTLRGEFVVRGEYLDERNLELAGRMKSCTSVSMHVRRGDYVDSPRYRHVVSPCSVAYYREALEWVRSRVVKPEVFVFSDEPDWCRNHLPLGANTTVVSINGPDQPWLDMHLMASCKHHIVANSSFSWWGAWLGRSEEQIVIAPARWLNPDSPLDGRDIVPDHWIRL